MSEPKQEWHPDKAAMASASTYFRTEDGKFGAYDLQTGKPLPEGTPTPADFIQVAVLKVADVCSAHVTWADWQLLMEDRFSPVTITKGADAWVNLDFCGRYASDWIDRGFSDHFVAVIKTLNDAGFQYVKFSGDAPVVAGWETFPW